MVIRGTVAVSVLLAGASLVGPAMAGGKRRCDDCAPMIVTPCPSATVAPEGSAPIATPTPMDTVPPESADQPITPDIPFDRFAAMESPSASIPDAGGGYLENPVIRSRIRVRSDFAYDANRPDRAEYFYPKCGCFDMPPGTAPDAKGPPLPETNINSYQEYWLYMEYALNNSFSLFVEPGIRGINPEVNANETGFGDMRAGARVSLYQSCNTHFTFQFRTYIPTGDGRKGLGTDHMSLEPGLLYYSRVGERLSLQAQLLDWIPIDGSHFQGNVLDYGVGVGYDIYRSCDRYVTPLVEVVGWTVLDGEQTNLAFPNGIQSAAGDTIVNVKLGARVGNDRNSLYAGYGRAVTGEVWYEDIFRVEYRLDF